MTYTKRAIPEATRRAVAERYGCEPGGTAEVECHWCGAVGRIDWARLRRDGQPAAFVRFTFELDHLIPEFRGGGGEPQNIVLACRRCNRSRGYSRPPHVLLTEADVRDHDRKGTGNREGKGRDVYQTQSRHVTGGEPSRAAVWNWR